MSESDFTEGQKKSFQQASLPGFRGAAYLRSATSEHISGLATRPQILAVQVYAAEHEINIVKTYIDEGRSGLRIEGREGLQSLFDDIQSGREKYDAVLLQDISRWGRDQSICFFCEDFCRRFNVAIRYVAEQLKSEACA